MISSVRLKELPMAGAVPYTDFLEADDQPLRAHQPLLAPSLRSPASTSLVYTAVMSDSPIFKREGPGKSLTTKEILFKVVQ